MRWQRRSHRRVRRWRSEGRLSCVVVYIEGLLFCFGYTEEIGVYYVPLKIILPLSCSFKKQIRRRRRMSPILLFLFWIPFFFASKKKVLVYVLPSYTILLYSLQFSANPSAGNLLKTAYLLHYLAKHAIWGIKKRQETTLPPLDNYSVPDSLTIKEFSYILLGYWHHTMLRFCKCPISKFT